MFFLIQYCAYCIVVLAHVLDDPNVSTAATHMVDDKMQGF